MENLKNSPSQEDFDETVLEDIEPEDPTVQEMQLEDIKTEEPTVEETQLDDIKPEDPTVQEKQLEDIKTEDPTVEETQLESIKPEDPTVEETQLEDINTEDPTVEESTSSKSISEESLSHHSGTESPLELPEGVQYFPAPNNTESTQSLRSSPSSLRSQSHCSTISLRWDVLACPKSRYLKDTLDRFGETLKPRNVKSLQKHLRDYKLLRGSTEILHLGKCTQPLTLHPPSGRRSPANQQRHEERTARFNAELKRRAFDQLAGKIFAKLPHLVLEADITELSRLPTTTQCMINVIFTIICSYAGKPLTIHDHELYQHLSVGLARFVEDVRTSVQRKICSDESITVTKEGEQRQKRGRGRFSMTTALLENLPEAKFLRSTEILKR